MRLALRSMRIDVPDGVRPIDLHMPGLGPPDRVLLRGEDGLAAWGTAVKLRVGTGPDRFAAASSALRALASEVLDAGGEGPLDRRLIALGSLSFAEDDPESVLVVPSRLVVRRDGVTWLTTLAPADMPNEVQPVVATSFPRLGDRVRFGGATVDDVAWLGAVDEALRSIEAGRMEKVVLARDQHVWSRAPFDLHALVHALAARYPDCTTFRIDGLVGASPEPLLSSDGATVRSRVLAGTAPRSEDPHDDRRLGAALRSSPKDNHEHALAVESASEALAEVVSELRVDMKPWILRLANVQHLATDLEGTLTRPVSSLELIGRLHPTAAVGGTPRGAALATIRTLEGMSRGRYAGPVGWTSAAGEGEWSIALRCGRFEGGRGRLFAGAGIVAGSRPEAELAETWLKLGAVRGILEDAGARPRPVAK